MEITKFHEMCMAFCKSQEDFRKFQSECHLLAVDVVRLLKGYFKIPHSQFALFRIDEKNEFEMVMPDVINALTLRQDSLWQFGIGLTLCSAPETLPQELILIQILIRKDAGDKFYLSYGENDNEFEVIKGKDRSFYPFFDFLHSTVIKTYEDKKHHFIAQHTQRKIGFEIKRPS